MWAKTFELHVDNTSDHFTDSYETHSQQNVHITWYSSFTILLGNIVSFNLRGMI